MVSKMLYLLLLTGLFKLVCCDKMDLYSQTDEVIILDGSNLKETLKNQSSMWLVEYYSSWCGTCHEFAPIFKKFAKDVAEWSCVINVGVVDCSEKWNSENCRSMNVQATPSLRLYSSIWNGTDVGTSVESSPSSKSIREKIIPFIEKDIENLKWDHNVSKPTFRPLSYDDLKTQLQHKERPLHFVVVLENSTSLMGKEVILDTSSCSNIEVRLMGESGGLQLSRELSLNREQLPHVVLFTRDEKPRVIDVKLKTRYFYVHELESLPDVGKPVAKFDWQLISQSESDGGRDWIGNSNIKNLSAIQWDRSYVIDIESAMNYMLSVEVSSNKNLYGDKLEAMKKLTKAFVETKEHFPGRRATYEFFENLERWLEDNGLFEYEEWRSFLDRQPGFPRSSHKWAGCQSGQASLRGYPCGLWTMFHALSVAYHNAGIQDQSSFYEAMKGYVTNFFSCIECRNNFKREIEQIRFDGETNKNSAAMLWLWRLHNSVNARLHNNSRSEDMDHPKVQFPINQQCPGCHKTTRTSKKFPKAGMDTWDEARVVSYLVERYSVQNLLLDYLPEIPPQIYDYYVTPDTPYASYPRFTSIDFNLCVFFWVTSVMLCGYACLTMRRRRGKGDFRTKHKGYRLLPAKSSW